MGETTSKQQQARAAILEIARRAVETGQTAVFWGYCLAVDVRPGAGGWIYLPGATRPIAHGRKAFAQVVVDSAELGTAGIVRVVDAMAEHYAKSMPEPESVVEFAGAHRYQPGAGDRCAYEDCGAAHEADRKSVV